MITAGTPITVDVRFTTSTGTAVDPDTVTMQYRHDDDIADIDDVERVAQGHYRGVFTPTEGGSYWVQAKGEGVAHTLVERILVAPDIEDVDPNAV